MNFEKCAYISKIGLNQFDFSTILNFVAMVIDCVICGANYMAHITNGY